MGVVNVTPDSFSDGGKHFAPDAALARAKKLRAAGAEIIDVGGYSTRPGAADVPPDEELARVRPVVEAVLNELPGAFVSVDTFRRSVAEPLLEAGAHIINDVTGGTADPGIFELPARYNAPYILTHIQGTPQTMQEAPQYDDLIGEIWAFFVEKMNALSACGATDIIIDPGFGFGKTRAHNLRILNNLYQFKLLGAPLLLGVSRKSTLQHFAEGSDTLPIDSALHLRALESGVSIIRAHDAGALRKITHLYQALADEAD